MSDYDYMNARVKGMSSHLLTSQFYEQVLAVPDQNLVVDSLLNSSYGPALREALAVGHGLPAVEDGLRRNLFETFAILRQLVPDGPRKLLEVQWRRWDIANIVTILRGKAAGIPAEEILPMLFPAGDLDDAQLGELANEPDVPAVTDSLTVWGVPLAFSLRRIIREHADPLELTTIETALAHEYFAWALTEAGGRDENHELIRGQIQWQIDLMNVMAALRTARQRLRAKEEPPEGYSPAPIPWGRISRSVLMRLQRCADLDEGMEILASTPFAPGVERGILAFGERGRLSIMERFLECVVIESGCRMFRADPLGIGVAAGYLWRKFNEFINLRILLRGKAYHRPAAAIREELLVV